MLPSVAGYYSLLDLRLFSLGPLYCVEGLMNLPSTLSAKRSQAFDDKRGDFRGDR